MLKNLKFENLPNMLLLELDENFMAYVKAANWLKQHLNIPKYQPQATLDKIFEDYFNCKVITYETDYIDFGPHYIEFNNEVDLTHFLLKWK